MLPCPICCTFCRLEAENDHLLRSVYGNTIDNQFDELYGQYQGERILFSTVTARASAAALTLINLARNSESYRFLSVHDLRDGFECLRLYLEDVALQDVDRSLKSEHRGPWAARNAEGYFRVTHEEKQVKASRLVMDNRSVMEALVLTPDECHREAYEVFGHVLHEVCSAFGYPLGKRMHIIQQIAEGRVFYDYGTRR